MQEKQKRQQRNSVIGLILGDAWGRSTEFIPLERLKQASYTAHDPHEGYEEEREAELLVTDDTQLSLAVSRAIASLPASDMDNTDTLFTVLQQHLSKWHRELDQVHRRAPGDATMNSIVIMADYLESPFPPPPGHTAFAVADSMGNGTIMRTSWLGLDTRIPKEALHHVVKVQSEMTHGHPLATLSSLLWTDLIRYVLEEDASANEWLPFLLDDLNNFLAKEWVSESDGQEMVRHLADAVMVITDMKEQEDMFAYDPSGAFRGGGTAPGALATAISIATVYAEKPQEALRRCALLGGDSDTIGALVGALVGVHASQEIPEWEDLFVDVEPLYRKRAEELIAYLNDPPQEH